jgi:hypothetical protein
LKTKNLFQNLAQNHNIALDNHKMQIWKMQGEFTMSSVEASLLLGLIEKLLFLNNWEKKVI